MIKEKDKISYDKMYDYILSSNLSSDEKILLSKIISLSKIRGYCNANNYYFEHCLNWSNSKLHRNFRKLKEKKLIIVKERNGFRVAMKPNKNKLIELYNSYIKKIEEENMLNQYLFDDDDDDDKKIYKNESVQNCNNSVAEIDQDVAKMEKSVAKITHITDNKTNNKTNNITYILQSNKKSITRKKNKIDLAYEYIDNIGNISENFKEHLKKYCYNRKTKRNYPIEKDDIDFIIERVQTFPIDKQIDVLRDATSGVWGIIRPYSKKEYNKNTTRGEVWNNDDYLNSYERQKENDDFLEAYFKECPENRGDWKRVT